MMPDLVTIPVGDACASSAAFVLIDLLPDLGLMHVIGLMSVSAFMPCSDYFCLFCFIFCYDAQRLLRSLFLF